jgi:hypothetical protein
VDEAMALLKEVRILVAGIVQSQHTVLLRNKDFPDDLPYFEIRNLLLDERHRPGDMDEWEKAMQRQNVIDAEDDKD